MTWTIVLFGIFITFIFIARRLGLIFLVCIPNFLSVCVHLGFLLNHVGTEDFDQYLLDILARVHEVCTPL